MHAQSVMPMCHCGIWSGVGQKMFSSCRKIQPFGWKCSSQQMED